MQIFVVKNKEEMAEKAYAVMKEVIINKPDAVIGLATGSTPLGLYAKMTEGYQKGEISYKNITTVNLDEYVGLDKSDLQSYDYFMRENLFNNIDVVNGNIYLPDGSAKDLDGECARYTELLNEKRQDIQLLGIGANGHIGFNEPMTDFNSTTNIVTLQEKTRADNARFFENADMVPTKAITMGIANIMNAKKILVLANGEGKSEAVYKMIKGEVNVNCPASVLQNHDDVLVIVDAAAAALL